MIKLDIDEFMEDIPSRYANKPITTPWGKAVVAKAKNGKYYAKIKIECYGHNCKKSKFFYLRRGCAGAGQYACDSSGKIIADLRDNVFYCEKHIGK